MFSARKFKVTDVKILASVRRMDLLEVFVISLPRQHESMYHTTACFINLSNEMHKDHMPQTVT